MCVCYSATIFLIRASLNLMKPFNDKKDFKGFFVFPVFQLDEMSLVFFYCAKLNLEFVPIDLEEIHST